MNDREDLKKRVTELENQVAALKNASIAGARGVRKRASWEIAGVPFYHIAIGPDLNRGELRGHAKGIIAVGDIATGVLALGGLARGVVALGGFAIGLVSLGGLSLGVLAAVGGLAIGSAALGGGAVGAVAVGGGAAGYYACGGGAFGKHVVDATQRSAEAERFFARYGATVLCPSR